MTTCQSCGSSYSEELERCPECNAEEAAFRCEKCGEEYASGDACPACGRLRLEVACEKHPDRSAGRRCVICGRALCATCDSGGGAALCEEHRTIPVIEGWAQVYSASNEFELQLLSENLKSEGIDAQVYSQRDRMFSMDLGELSIVRLLVPVWEYAQAIEIIKSHMDTEGEVTFACPGCGEAYETGSSECTSCGAALA